MHNVGWEHPFKFYLVDWSQSCYVHYLWVHMLLPWLNAWMIGNHDRQNNLVRYLNLLLNMEILIFQDRQLLIECRLRQHRKRWSAKICKTPFNKTHQTQSVILLANTFKHYIPVGDLQEFADCTEFKHRRNLPITQRYQMFMNLKWNVRDKTPPKWSKRKQPTWYVDLRKDI